MSQDELTIQRTDEAKGRVLVFALRGSLDLATSKDLREAMSREDAGDDKDVIVDLRGLEFIDSTGLGALIGAHKRAVEHGRTLRVVLNEGSTERLLNITGLVRVFALYRSIEDAVADRDRVAGSA